MDEALGNNFQLGAAPSKAVTIDSDTNGDDMSWHTRVRSKSNKVASVESSRESFVDDARKKGDKRTRRKGMMLVSDEDVECDGASVTKYFQEHQEQQKRQQVFELFQPFMDSISQSFKSCNINRQIMFTSSSSALMSTKQHKLKKNEAKIIPGHLSPQSQWLATEKFY